MSKLQFQYDLQNLTPANAQPVEANFTKVEQHINQEVVERDGTVAMRAQLKLVGDPIAALDAAPKQYVDQVLPIGLIMMYGAATPPANGRWLVCDGAPLQTATYPELFAVIGYSFGGAGGSFNTPNLTDRFAVGVGSRALGAAGGSADSSLPAHAHTIDHGHTGSAGNDSPDHTHGVDHYHLLGGTAASAGSHWHQPSNAGDFVVGGGAVGGPPQGWTGPAAISNVDGDKYGKVGGTGNAGDHTHTVSGNTNYMSQTPGQGPNSTGASARHSHPVTVNGMSGASGQAGVAPAGTNMPPFLAIQHIIRCK